VKADFEAVQSWSVSWIQDHIQRLQEKMGQQKWQQDQQYVSVLETELHLMFLTYTPAQLFMRLIMYHIGCATEVRK